MTCIIRTPERSHVNFPYLSSVFFRTYCTVPYLPHTVLTVYAHCTVYSVQCTLYIVHCTLYTIHNTQYMYIVHSNTQYNVQYAMYYLI